MYNKREMRMGRVTAGLKLPPANGPKEIEIYYVLFHYNIFSSLGPVFEWMFGHGHIIKWLGWSVRKT